MTDNAFELLEPQDDRSEEPAPLQGVADRVRYTLQPVSPDHAFRARLRDSLAMAARHQQAQRLMAVKRGEPGWGWLLGAAALGSAAGVLAVMWRSRGQTHKTAAPAQVRN
jgi:hypothetical protein